MAGNRPLFEGVLTGGQEARRPKGRKCRKYRKRSAGSRQIDLEAAAVFVMGITDV